MIGCRKKAQTVAKSAKSKDCQNICNQDKLMHLGLNHVT